MTVFELHLNVNQRLQLVASYKRNVLLPQEIDLALNKAMYRLLEQGVASKFQDNEINLSHVTALLKKNTVSEVIIPGASDQLYEENELTCYAVKPPDFYWLANSRVEVLVDPFNCETAPTLGNTIATETVGVLPFIGTASTGYHFKNYTITSLSIPIIYRVPTAIINGFSSPKSRYVVINNVLEAKLPGNVKVYWERYRDTYYPNSFIFVSATNNLAGLSATADNTTTEVSSNTQTNYSVPNRALINGITNKKILTAPVKTTQNDLLYQLLSQNTFYKSSTSEVIGDETLDYFTLYREKSFLVTRVSYDYIRKPRTISLDLNQSCELASTTHQKIVDLAVEILRLDIKDEVYPVTVQDTQLRTT